MYEGFNLKKALEELVNALPCGNNPFCLQNGDHKDKDACFGCVLFDLKEYSEELHGSAIVGEPYGDIYELKAELAALREKYRWRKQSEEPAGDFLENDAPAECLDMEYGIPSVRISRCGGVDHDEYWRSLDLLEAESK